MAGIFDLVTTIHIDSTDTSDIVLEEYLADVQKRLRDNYANDIEKRLADKHRDIYTAKFNELSIPKY